METVHIREVILRYDNARISPERLNDPEPVADFLRKILPCNTREHFLAIYLDTQLQAIGYRVVATGTAGSCIVHPREVFQPAVLLGARGVIVAHNHPSGVIATSKEDDEMTRKLKAAAETLGVTLLDHLVLTDTEHYSYQEMGRL